MSIFHLVGVLFYFIIIFFFNGSSNVKYKQYMVEPDQVPHSMVLIWVHCLLDAGLLELNMSHVMRKPIFGSF